MATIYGYARTSTAQQNIERQRRNILQQFPTAQIVEERFTGTTCDRPAFQRLLKRLQPGDTLVCDSVSRFSRNAEEGASLYAELYARGVRLVFLNEPMCNSEVYAAALEQAAHLPEMPKSGDAAADTFLATIHDALQRFMCDLARRQFEAAFRQAQVERDDLSTRTKQGLVTARLNGAQIGRQAGTTVETAKAKASKAFIRQRAKTFGGDLTDAEAIKILEIDRGTYYNYKRQLREAAAD